MINTILIALILLNNAHESHEMGFVTNIGRLWQRPAWTYDPFRNNNQQIYHWFDVQPPRASSEIIYQQAKDSSRKPFGYDEKDGWRKKKGSPTYISPDGIEYTEDKKHQNNKPGGHFDGVDPRTGDKVIEVDYEGNKIWPDGPKNKNK